MAQTFRAVFDPPERADLAVKVIGCGELVTPGVRFLPGMPDWFLAVFEEPAPVLVDAGWCRVPAGTLVILPPHSPVCHGEPNGGCRRSWLRCNGPAVPRLVTQAGLPLRQVIAVDDPELHQRWLRALHEECLHPRGADPHNVEALVGCWLRAVRRAADGIATTAADTVAAAAKRIIDGAYLEDLDLDQLAQRAGGSRSALCRAFRTAYGTSPMASRRRLRMARAEDLLTGTELGVGAIAERCAFRDIYYFSRAFRATHGCTPSAWRRRARD